VIPQPTAKTPASLADLKAGRFELKRTSGKDELFAAGDVENVSGNFHRRIKVNLDLLDERGAKIGAVSDIITELPAHKTWHVIARVSDRNAVSVRFSGMSEEP
jgi:hypothetical protein